MEQRIKIKRIKIQQKYTLKAATHIGELVGN